MGAHEARPLDEVDEARIAVIEASLACVAALGQSYEDGNRADDVLDLAVLRHARLLIAEPDSTDTPTDKEN